MASVVRADGGPSFFFRAEAGADGRADGAVHQHALQRGVAARPVERRRFFMLEDLNSGTQQTALHECVRGGACFIAVREAAANLVAVLIHVHFPERPLLLQLPVG